MALSTNTYKLRFTGDSLINTESNPSLIWTARSTWKRKNQQALIQKVIVCIFSTFLLTVQPSSYIFVLLFALCNQLNVKKCIMNINTCIKSEKQICSDLYPLYSLPWAQEYHQFMNVTDFMVPSVFYVICLSL